MEKDVLGLATIRRNRGISLEEIANSTKISKRSLEAIEQGEFQKLPGGIYSTSYIRQYARAIDYDEDALLSYYYCETGVGGERARQDGKTVLTGLGQPSTVAGN